PPAGRRPPRPPSGAAAGGRSTPRGRAPGQRQPWWAAIRRRTRATSWIVSAGCGGSEVHRKRRRSLIAAPAVAAVLTAFALTAAPARADVCDAIPTIPLVPNPAKTGCKVATGIGGAGAQALSNPAKAAGSLL